MQISIILLGKLINFFIMILLGFILVNKNILKSSDSRILSIIVVYLVMPCAIIGSFEIDFTKEKLQGEALIIAKEFWPDLILSDIMMPEMRGDELCVAIKNDIETSHIPVLLLTALGDENNILDGMSIGADAYIVKPFNVRILKASIANLLANRALLRSRYANLDIDSEPMIPSANGTTSLDWQFISAVKKSIEENMDNTGFSVDVLCELHHMSRTSFYCKLKALTGQSPTDLIRITRLKRATQLLKEGGHTIAEISDMTGFSESKYFREVFKKHYKMSPTKYAKEGSNSSPIITEDNLSDD